MFSLGLKYFVTDEPFGLIINLKKEIKLSSSNYKNFIYSKIFYYGIYLFIKVSLN